MARVAVCGVLGVPVLCAGIADAQPAATAVLPAAKPAAPGRPTAQAGPGEIELSWRAPSDDGGKKITAYRVQREKPDGSWVTLTSSASARKRTYTATGLVNGRSYSFRVAAINADGRGPDSRAVTARPRPLALAPQSVTATAGDRSATIRWSPPRNNVTTTITGYRIQRQGSNGRFTTVTTVAANKRSHRVTGLTNGSTVRVRVNAVNSIGQGASSAAVAVTLPVTLSVAAGGNHTCVVMPDTTVTCFGSDTAGELGDGTVGGDRTDGVTVLASDGVSPLTGVASVDVSIVNSCAVLLDGGVVCWGSSAYGQLGDDVSDGAEGFLAEVPRAVVVRETVDESTTQPLGGAVEVTVGERHACARLGDGSVRCWGGGAGGQRGDNTTIAQLSRAVTVLTGSVSPVALADVVEIDAGLFHTCARLESGSLRCWGAGINGILGNGSTEDALVATPVSSITTATDIGMGEGHSCAVLADGTARCWGHNQFGKVGDGGEGGTEVLTPTTVLDETASGALTGISRVAGGKNGTCALMTDGTARCWGYNEAGQNGDGTTTDSALPVTVSTGSGAQAGIGSLTVGGDHGCVRLADGRLRCWGYNGNGQVGDGSTENRLVTVPVTAL